MVKEKIIKVKNKGEEFMFKTVTIEDYLAIQKKGVKESNFIDGAITAIRKSLVEDKHSYSYFCDLKGGSINKLFKAYEYVNTGEYNLKELEEEDRVEVTIGDDKFIFEEKSGMELKPAVTLRPKEGQTEIDIVNETKIREILISSVEPKLERKDFLNLPSFYFEAFNEATNMLYNKELDFEEVKD